MDTRHNVDTDKIFITMKRTDRENIHTSSTLETICAFIAIAV